MGYQLNQNMMLSEIAQELSLAHQGLDLLITGVSPIDSAQVSELTFSKQSITNSKGLGVITSDNLDNIENWENGYISSSNPRLDFIKALDFLKTNIGFSTYNKPTDIHPTAILGKNIIIEDGCYIGENTIIEHNVVIHSGTRIGKNCRIRSCSSIGSDGFGFERLESGIPIRFPHLGGVLIGDSVEVGSCTAIARGTLSDTIIEDHVKIDNLVHIAHNCLIKKGAFIIACAELSGGVIVGENAWVAPNSCTHQKINIGANSLIGLGAVITKDIPQSTVYAGNPAKKIRDIK
ncbi:UDP-3-O-(3-hydroxymyristoyl)glucosamine N-acyltransferase [uncultured Thiothrix sp.]|uniref:UDP-3-O-(3-hydroxymyristoyl)glucosamine N-acyltransferase n=1 Tax=uncultured Thiothrix sp. TaxID=223185 RepID=UPI002612C55B|nr:UDP-3-O-(3-hydroxymyristoyl)glucosamine N-acyltransferase [uncultured Thiothrix sp.]